jgi:hypothetical protein
MGERTPGRRWATVIGPVVLLGFVPACSSASTPSTATTTTTTTTTPVTVPQGSSAAVAGCEADARTLEAALDAYMAQKGSYPSPTSPWSAATYVANFQPLTTASGGEGPYLSTPPATTRYVIEYDSSGHVWVAPPGAYGASYNPGQSFEAGPDVCLAAVR